MTVDDLTQTLSFADIDIGTRTLDGEAGNQGTDGLTAVAWVIRNRMTWAPYPWWGNTVETVCKKPWQFSAWNGGPDTERIKALKQTDAEYARARAVLLSVMSGGIPDLTGGATTYKVRGTPAEWDRAVAAFPPREIGIHDFWRLSDKGPCMAFLDESATGVVNV